MNKESGYRVVGTQMFFDICCRYGSGLTIPEKRKENFQIVLGSPQVFVLAGRMNLGQYMYTGLSLSLNLSPVNNPRIIIQKMNTEPVSGNTRYCSKKQCANY